MLAALLKNTHHQEPVLALMALKLVPQDGYSLPVNCIPQKIQVHDILGGPLLQVHPYHYAQE